MSFVLCDIKDSVATIILNRPEKFNAFNRAMALQLQQVLDDCSLKKEVRAIYLTGHGKAFCAGQDLGELVGKDAPGFDQILSQHYNPIVKRIRSINKPIVCAVNGVAAGAGANIALCCDVVVAAQSAFFIQAFSKIGLIPDSGGTFTLPRLIGWQKASAIMMLGDKVSALEAERIGMIYKVIPDESFTEESKQLAAVLAGMPTVGLANTKKALNESFANTFEQQLQTEDRLQYESAHTYDYNEGIQAFLEKRTPVFKGI
ncbi:MAG: enoyl-CoA hydratase-related protein [Chitinophagaceae bacterium]